MVRNLALAQQDQQQQENCTLLWMGIVLSFPPCASLRGTKTKRQPKHANCATVPVIVWERMVFELSQYANVIAHLYPKCRFWGLSE